MSADRILVPVSESSTLRQTVEYVVETALGGDGGGSVRFIFVHPPEISAEFDEATERDVDSADAEELFNRIRVWAEEDADGAALTVETGHIGTEEYLFSPTDIATAIAAEADDHDTGRVVLDPEYDPGVGPPLLRPLEYELARFEGFTVEEAPVTRATRRTPLLAGSTPIQAGALFGIAFLFYQFLASSLAPFDLVTGTISGIIVALSLSRITFRQDPSGETVVQLVRLAVYTPYLLWEIVKANIAVAVVILDPRLPIDPRMTRIQPAVWGALPVTALANSITLTPGTLTVRVQGRQLMVHTLVPGARQDLFDGGLERGVRFVFYGRQAMRIAGLGERGDAENLQSADSDSQSAGENE